MSDIVEYGGEKYKVVRIIVTAIMRILIFPFFAALGLMAALILWVKWVCNFVIYGGEAISYTRSMNRKTIQDVFERLVEETETEER